jgi:hypothetical protein
VCQFKFSEDDLKHDYANVYHLIKCTTNHSQL